MHALVAAFDAEAKKHDVYPLSAATAERFASSLRPYPLGKLTDFTFYPSEARYPNGAFPDIRNRSWTIAASLSGPAAGGDGMIATQGGAIGGWGLLIRSGKPVFVYRRSNQPDDLTRLSAPDALLPGPHEVSVDFVWDGGRLGAGGTLSLKVDGKERCGHASARHGSRVVPAGGGIDRTRDRYCDRGWLPDPVPLCGDHRLGKDKATIEDARRLSGRL